MFMRDTALQLSFLVVSVSGFGIGVLLASQESGGVPSLQSFGAV